MISREKEIKLDLSNEENYLKLLDFFQGSKHERQLENHFFDTEDWALSRSGWALRLREEENSATITAKGTADKGIEKLTVRPEIEQNIPAEVIPVLVKQGIYLSDLPASLAKILEDRIAGKRLTERLSFTTYRTVARYETDDTGFVFEIDRTLFPDGSVDYELEVELDDMSQFPSAMDAITDIFNQVNIEISCQKDSKFARALKKLDLDSDRTA